ncbi:tetratricopeptide repeat protein [Endozoicomonas ascidiicola]|uniref:tetratricopeptide repeat protein n=1 Tax=Endozoicomonas ascidiicola TaxID=1698521 RepID=UPI000832866D|nr:tetratricopeptide repeat protein [Endozoicomonas ascidiicola]
MDNQPTTASNVLGWMAQGGTFQKLRNISQSQLDEAYKVAFTQFNAGQYKDAVTIFRHLCLMNHTCHRYFLGLGMSLFELGRFDLAIASLSYAEKIEPKDPRASLVMGKSFKAMNQKTLALKSLSEAIFRAQKGVRWQSELHIAQRLYAALKNKR